MIGNQIIELPEVNSTNQYAIELLSKSRPLEGTVISAKFQYGGKGQFGSKWESKAGKNINLSVILYPTFVRPDQQFFLNMAICNAIQETISIFVPRLVDIKWPNDILVDDRKICGILIQNALLGKEITSTVIGIGINVNQKHFKNYSPKATSILHEIKDITSLISLSAILYEKLNSYYTLLKFKEYALIKTRYLSRLYGFQTWKSYQYPDGKKFLGKIIDVKENGYLSMQIDEEIHSFAMKEIKIDL